MYWLIDWLIEGIVQIWTERMDCLMCWSLKGLVSKVRSGHCIQYCVLSGLWTWWLKTLTELRIVNVSTACHRVSAAASDSIEHWHFVTNARHSAHLPRGFLYFCVIYLFIFISMFIFPASSELSRIIGKIIRGKSKAKISSVEYLG